VADINKEVFKKFKQTLDARILRSEQEVRSWLKDKFGDVYSDDENSSKWDHYIFNARSKTAKELAETIDRLGDIHRQEFKRELSYSKDERYPMNWMLNNKGIAKTLDRYPLVVPLLNHIFNLNRRLRGEDFKAMVQLTDKITGGEKFGKHEFASFVADKAFYIKVESELDITQITIQKYMQSLCNCGIIQKLGKIRQGGMLYSDGYFVPWRNRHRKASFLKETPDFKRSLRNLTIKF